MVFIERAKFWLLFTAASALAAGICYRYFDQISPVVNLSISVDRHEALQRARALASDLGWDLQEYQDVTSFESQDDLQCFVELEAGGKDAFVAMFESGTYYPYRWHVRFFKPQQIIEMHVWFAPDGTPIGFSKKVPQQATGAILSKEQALQVVENKINDWCKDFEQYKLIEYENEVRDTGRVDHEFTFERTDISLGKGLYRFKASVCGDELVRCKPFVKIPDAFTRHYKEMRSANLLLASVGAFFFRSLYLLFFCLCGLVFFYRRKYFFIKQSALAAGFVAGGMLLKGLNQYPLWWSSYNTVQATSIFLLAKLSEQVLGFISYFILVLLAVVVAEAAGRYTYKQHVQFFKSLNVQFLGYQELAHQVLFGYLMVPFMFLYVLIFGYLTKTYAGWWSPAGSLFDPNVLAGYFPAISALTISLYAGFFEEVICRALPLAMIAVVTKENKSRKFWFVVMFLAQALIFGACHADYPNQPSYARLVELILPSFGFGWMYLQFGLLPGIIIHFVYDTVWFAMPIFVSSLLWAKVGVIAIAGIPLWVVMFAYLKSRSLPQLPQDCMNQAYVEQSVHEQVMQEREIGQSIPVLYQKILFVTGLCGLLLWVGTAKFQSDVDPLAISKAQAIAVARAEIAQKFDQTFYLGEALNGQRPMDDSWTCMAVAQDGCSLTPARFIWQVYGKAAYQQLLGSYLSGVRWQVRCVRFAGSVEERNEEFTVLVDQTDHVVRAEHNLPEQQPGADIDQEQALKIAYQFITQTYGLQASDFSLISVTSDKFEQRRDWKVVVQDLHAFEFTQQGQARISIGLAGHKIASYARFIFVPEDWQRADQARMMQMGLVKMGLWFLLILLVMLSLLVGIKRLATARYGTYLLHRKGGFVGLVALLYTMNSFIVVMAMFNTAEPLSHQMTRTSLGLITKLSYQILFCSILLALGAVSFVKGKKSRGLQSWSLAAAGAYLLMGLTSLVSWLEPQMQPFVGQYDFVGHSCSSLAFCMSELMNLCTLLSLMTALFLMIKAVRAMWPSRLWLQVLVFGLFALSFQGLQTHSSLFWIFLSAGALAAGLYAVFVLALQFDMTLAPLIFALIAMHKAGMQIIYPLYGAARCDALFAVACLFASAILLYEWAHQE